MARIERIDNEDSFETIFKVQTSTGHQEIRVPTFIADIVEQRINSPINFEQERLRKGSKIVLD